MEGISIQTSVDEDMEVLQEEPKVQGHKEGLITGDIMHSNSSQEVQHNEDLSLDKPKQGSLTRQDFVILEGSRVVRGGGGRGRAHKPGHHPDISDHPRGTQHRQRLVKNVAPPNSQSDNSKHFAFMQKGKSRWVKYEFLCYQACRTLCYN